MTSIAEPQVLTAPDGSEMVVITRARYDELLAAAEELEDIAAAEEGAASLAEEGGIPFEVERSIAAGSHPIVAWRKYRRWSQGRLAEEAGPLTQAGSLTQAAIARLEAAPTGSGRPDTLAAIARALGAPPWTLEGVAPRTPRGKLRRAISHSTDPVTGRFLQGRR